MALLAMLQVSGLLGFTWWLLGHYKDARVPAVVHGAVFASWVLGFLGLLLLPMDLATNGVAASTADSKRTAVETVTRATYLLAWRLLYWFTFIMSWAALPFLVEFRQNGEFTLEKRVVSSLRHLLLHWTILVGGMCIVALYLVFVDHLSLYGVLGLAMAASNTYGLVWVIALLGYGLVEIPRGFWLRRQSDTQLQQLHFRAVQLHDERMEARFEYDEVATDVREAHQRMLKAESDAIILTGEMQYVKTCLMQVVKLVEKHRPSFQSVGSTGSSSKPGNSGGASFTDVSGKKKRGLSSSSGGGGSSKSAFSKKAPMMSEVVVLHRRVRVAQLELRRCDEAFLELCITVDMLRDCTEQRTLPVGSLYPATSPLNRLLNGFQTARHGMRRWITAPVCAACAVATGILSLCVLWGEFTISWHVPSLSLFRLLIVTETDGTSSSLGSVTELVAVLLLVYLALCCYTSLFTLRLPGKFALRAHGNSTELCLLKTSIHQCRLQFALGQNALLLLRGGGKVTDGTAFHELLANMRVVHVFGGTFTEYAPLLMLALGAFTLGNGYARIMRRIGLEQYEQVIPNDPAHVTVIEEGERLVQQGLERQRALISRKKKAYDAGGGAYGFASASDGAQALLIDDDEQEAGAV